MPVGAAHAAGGCPTSEDCIVVSVIAPGGTRTQTISLDQLADNDLTDQHYRVRKTPGGPVSDGGVGTVDAAVSVRHLVRDIVGIDPATVSRVNFAVPDHPQERTSALGSSELAPSGSNGYESSGADTTLMPAIYLVGNDRQISYIRPLVANDPDDVNSARSDRWQTDGPVQMFVWTTDELLTGTIKASPTSTTVGRTVSFSVDFDGAPDLSGAQYSWTFGDSATIYSGSKPSYTWSGKCTCTVHVDIGGQGIGSNIPSVKIQVGKPPKVTSTPGDTDSGTSTNPKNPTSGSANSTGLLTAPGLTILQGRAGLPEAAPQPVLTPPLGAGQPVALTGLSRVSGVFLEAGTGEIAPTAETPPTLTPESAAARRTHRTTSYGWLWYLLVPGLIVAGALVELRPRRRTVS